MKTAADFRIENVERVIVNGKNRISFKAYKKDTNGDFVACGTFFANLSVKKSDFWKIAVAEMAQRNYKYD